MNMIVLSYDVKNFDTTLYVCCYCYLLMLLFFYDLLTK